jgi:hypothetical protein
VLPRAIATDARVKHSLDLPTSLHKTGLDATAGR